MIDPAQAISHHFLSCGDAPGSQDAKPLENAAPTPTMPNNEWWNWIFAAAG